MTHRAVWISRIKSQFHEQTLGLEFGISHENYCLWANSLYTYSLQLEHYFKFEFIRNWSCPVCVTNEIFETRIFYFVTPVVWGADWKIKNQHLKFKFGNLKTRRLRCFIWHFFPILITGFQIRVTDVKRCSITKNCKFLTIYRPRRSKKN